MHAALTVSAALRRQRPLPVDKNLSVVLGGASELFGSHLFAAGVWEFRSFEQMSGVLTGKLVTGGPYCRSRNPQVVGWGLALVGAAIAGRSVRALLLVAAFFLVHRLHAPIEERHLERVFGEEYRHYRTAAPRLLGPRGLDNRVDLWADESLPPGADPSRRQG